MNKFNSIDRLGFLRDYMQNVAVEGLADFQMSFKSSTLQLYFQEHSRKSGKVGSIT